MSSSRNEKLYDKRIKVLFTIPNFNTAGAGSALLNVAMRLDPDLFDVSIACNHSKGSYFEQVKASGLPVHIFQITVPLKPRFSLIFRIWKLSRTYRKLKQDIVYSYHYMNDYSEPLAVRLAGAKWGFCKNNMSWGDNGWKLRSWLANGIVVINSTMLKRFYPGSKKVSFVPHGLDIAEYKPIAPQKQALEQYGVSLNVRIIICIANLVPVKGIEVLMSAFDKIASRHENTHLLIIGDDAGDYGDSLKELAAKSPASGRITFTGKTPHVRSLISVADIVVLPTLKSGREEAFGLVVMEGKAMEKYVLASDTSGPKDQMADFPELIFPAGNSDALAEKLDTALRLPETERKKIGVALRDDVVKNYTIEREVRQLEDFFLKMMNRKRK